MSFCHLQLCHLSFHQCHCFQVLQHVWYHCHPIHLPSHWYPSLSQMTQWLTLCIIRSLTTLFLLARTFPSPSVALHNAHMHVCIIRSLLLHLLTTLFLLARTFPSPSVALHNAHMHYLSASLYLSIQPVQFIFSLHVVHCPTAYTPPHPLYLKPTLFNWINAYYHHLSVLSPS